MFVESIRLADSAFGSVAIYRLPEIPLGDRDQNLVHSLAFLWTFCDQHLKREQIKRGTPVKEFLDIIFFRESFFFTKRKFPHEIKLRNLLHGGGLRKGTIYA